MRSAGSVLVLIILVLLCSSTLAQISDKLYNVSSAEPPNSGPSIQIAKGAVPHKNASINMLWLDDPREVYYRMFCTSLMKGDWVRAEVLPAATGDLMIYRKSLSEKISSQNMGSVQAGNQYDLWTRFDDDAWYNELWYDINGNESNHIWFYIYDKEFSQYLR